jgi:hypothetical protein
MSSSLQETAAQPARTPARLLTPAQALAVVGALAGWLPARRAAGVDPVMALLRSLAEDQDGTDTTT